MPESSSWAAPPTPNCHFLFSKGKSVIPVVQAMKHRDSLNFSLFLTSSNPRTNPICCIFRMSIINSHVTIWSEVLACSWVLENLIIGFLLPFCSSHTAYFQSGPSREFFFSVLLSDHVIRDALKSSSGSLFHSDQKPKS